MNPEKQLRVTKVNDDCGTLLLRNKVEVVHESRCRGRVVTNDSIAEVLYTECHYTTMVKLEYTVLNAFTTSSDSGNPAAVTILPPPTNINKDDMFSAYPPTPALQAIATKLNYPMTAFLLPLGFEDGKYALRWIDPGTEVQLCGHATVALSEYLFSLPNSPKRLELETVKHGLVVSQRLSNPLKDGDERLALDFPEILGLKDLERSTEEWSDFVKGLKEVTGKDMPIAQLRRNDHYLIVEFEAAFDMSAGGLPLNMEKLVRLRPGHS